MRDSSPNIQLSVALVTRNRPDWLRRCLESWRSQSHQPFEIVISDDSDQDFEADIARLADEFGCRYVRGPKRGLYANRNNAALACNGSHIMSADDDHTHPTDFVERVMADIAMAPESLWTYSERHPLRPDEPLRPIPELTPDNRIKPPRDFSSCRGVADGSTVHPRRIFDRGMRYDETYPFGMLYYLWGQELSRNGYRIRFSDASFVWHDTDSSLDRSDDPLWNARQLECDLYVLFRNAIRLNKNPIGLARAVLKMIRTCFFSILAGKRVDRISTRAAARALRNAIVH